MAQSLAELQNKVVYLKDLANFSELSQEITRLQEKTISDSFWHNRQEAIKVNTALKEKEDLYQAFQTIEEDLQLIQAFASDMEAIEKLSSELEKKISDLELNLQFTGEFDHCSALLEIHPGAGGVDSHDWAEMLFRMYVRFAELHNLKVSVIDRIDGDEAGLKSVTLQLDGNHPYGLLKSEKGVHRLVRVSPFDSNQRRHTSFASVLVSPIIEESVELEIPEKDLRIDTYRSGGHGGQNVNKIETAVRVTHLPTGIACACQTERSQALNKEIAMRHLKSKLYEIEKLKMAEKLNNIVGEKAANEWGSQIRNYVFFPYTLVKDTRTGYEEGDVTKVMDGYIDGFIKAYLVYTRSA